MNKVFLIGNLTRDPELRETPSGVAMCRFGIAVQRPYSSSDGERQADFFDCTAWRGLAETIARYTKKGNKVAVSGSIQLRNYEDNQGVKRNAVDIIVQDCEFLTPKTSDSFDDALDAPRSSAPKKKPTLQTMDDDSDIPF
ncbi:MAG: single-stranded DNA-binding protein [Clostridia bacterium]|nr:single-stranded DNA-binding protein [Clostridia bacterium]MBQ8447079.1 single-stranded DNA-binding protein [Clostridia bacterium]